MRTLANALKSFLFEESPSLETGPSSSSEGSRDCVLVIDASGSMLDDDWKPARLDGAKDAAVAFAERLSVDQPNSRIGIVAFGCKSRIVCRLTQAGRFDYISKKIRQIEDGGGTNMYAGLRDAHDLLKYSAGTSQVVLLTDGQNTGKEPGLLADRLKQSAIVECVGIGGSPGEVDEPLLRTIASAYPDGSKRYRWIGQKEQLVRHFHKLAGGIRRT